MLEFRESLVGAESFFFPSSTPNRSVGCLGELAVVIHHLYFKRAGGEEMEEEEEESPS